MLNEQLLQQVREGKASIWNNDKSPEGNKKIKELVYSISDRVIFVWGESTYYWLASNGLFNAGLTNPTGLTPIPLDDFFKEEKARTYSGSQHVRTSDQAKEYFSKNKGPITPAPDHVPDTGNMIEGMKGVESEHMEVIRNCAEYTCVQESKNHAAITIGYMGRFAEWVDHYRYSCINGVWFYEDNEYTTAELVRHFINNPELTTVDS